jgi:putative pyruvate formate lyase activating enzyme
MRIARAALHFFEEPPISGTRGSGTVFFVGCSLRCVFCQNRVISRADRIGRVVTPEELADIFLSLEAQGAHNINLVTPTHFADGLLEALTMARSNLTVPVVYNTSGYERVETLRRLDGLVDIYLPDFKYISSELSSRYSAAPDYAEVAADALREMFRQVGRYEIGEDGLMQRGMIVRHMVLPKGRQDSIAVLDRLAELLPVDGILLSLMSQYTPEFAMDSPYAELHRKVTTFEYRSVVERAAALGFDGFMQEKSSATAQYTPDFEVK